MSGREETARPAKRRQPYEVAWPLVLVWQMRITAIVWLAKGLIAWMTILGFGSAPFETMPPPTQAAVVGFAVGNLIAGVGLWLTASWGGVIFLFVAIAELALVALAPGVIRAGGLETAANAVLILAYLVTAFMAARGRDW